MTEFTTSRHASTAASPVQFQYFGVASLLFSQGQSHILTDGFFSRPGRAQVLFGKISPDLQKITDRLEKAGIAKLDAVLVGHSHYDHALDSAAVAKLTNAQLVGSSSTAQLAKGCGLLSEQITLIQPGHQLNCGSFKVSFIPSCHSFPNIYPGEIISPVFPPARVSAYREGGSYAIFIETDTQNIFIHNSAGFLSGFLAHHTAETVFLSVASLSRATPDFIERYFTETILAVKAKRVYPIHWDDFQKPAGEGLSFPPAWVDNVKKSLRLLENFCLRHQVIYHIPPYANPLNLNP
jgi:L-ascorbate metabolism protein UlaG (beta-lactamase superfamily)